MKVHDVLPKFASIFRLEVVLISLQFPKVSFPPLKQSSTNFFSVGRGEQSKD